MKKNEEKFKKKKKNTKLRVVFNNFVILPTIVNIRLQFADKIFKISYNNNLYVH